MTSVVPTEADWRSEPWGIDTPYAYEHFAGKSLAEAVSLFKKNASFYDEDVMWMPSACFTFYVRAYMQYLLSDDSKGDSDGSNGFFGLVEFRSQEIRANPPLATTVAEVLRHLATRQLWYDADVSVYGDFAERSRKALKLIES